MTHINLLPWRAQKRQREKRLFISLLVSCIAFTALFILLINYSVSSLVSNQIIRNQMLQHEIATYEGQIKEIKHMDKLRERLIARMLIVRNLQSMRTLMVHLLDELVNITPPGVFLNKIEGKNNLITLSGCVETSTYISQQMKNIELSAWIHNPVLSEIKKIKDKNQVVDNEFKLTFVLAPKYLVGGTA